MKFGKIKQYYTKSFRALKNATASTFNLLANSLAKHREAACYYGILILVLGALSVFSYNFRSNSFSLPEQAAESVDVGVTAQSPVEEGETAPTPALPEAFYRPVSGEVLVGFNTDELVWSEDLGQWQTHPALDFCAAPGEAVAAVADGTVQSAYYDPLNGYTIVIELDDGRLVHYASLNTIQLVEASQQISRGEIISSAGICPSEESLGTHLHLAVYRDGKPEDPTILFTE